MGSGDSTSEGKVHQVIGGRRNTQWEVATFELEVLIVAELNESRRNTQWGVATLGVSRYRNDNKRVGEIPSGEWRTSPRENNPLRGVYVGEIPSGKWRLGKSFAVFRVIRACRRNTQWEVATL